MINRNIFLAAVSAVVALGLGGCGGGSGDDSGPSSPNSAVKKVYGTAATNAPLANALVQVRCSDSSNIKNTKTNAQGNWELDIGSSVLPCAVRVSDGGLPIGVAHYSLLAQGDVANVSALTDLVLAGVLKQAPAAWWGASGPIKLDLLTQERAAASLSALRSGLGLAALQNVDPAKTSFEFKADDKIANSLKALYTALAQWKSAGKAMNYDTLLLAATAPGGLVLADSYRADIAKAYNTVTSPGTTPPVTGGNYSLRISSNALSQYNGGPVLLQGVGRPTSEANFCNQVEDQTSPLYPGKYLPKGWSFLGCSFADQSNMIIGLVTVAIPASGTTLGYTPSVLNYRYQ